MHEIVQINMLITKMAMEIYKPQEYDLFKNKTKQNKQMEKKNRVIRVIKFQHFKKLV